MRLSPQQRHADYDRAVRVIAGIDAATPPATNPGH